jgi:hypothetical protein
MLLALAAMLNTVAEPSPQTALLTDSTELTRAKASVENSEREKALIPAFVPDGAGILLMRVP